MVWQFCRADFGGSSGNLFGMMEGVNTLQLDCGYLLSIEVIDEALVSIQVKG